MRKLTTSLFFVFLFSLAYGQTQQKFETILDGITIHDICSDGQNLWIATNGAGIYKYNIKSKKLDNYSVAAGNIKHDFFYCLAANDNYVWAGSTDGLFVLDKKSDRWTQRKFGKGGQLGNWIRSLAYDKYLNVLWIGRFQYLTKYDLRTRLFDDFDLTIQGNQKTNNIKKVTVDGDSLVWFGSEAGLHKYSKKKNLIDQGAILFYDTKFNYFNGEGEQVSITSLLFEQRNLWIGLDEFITPDRPQFNIGGLYKFDRRNEWKRFDASTGLAGNGIFCLERTGNYIWAGLYQFGQSSKESYGRGIALINRLNNQVRVLNDPNIPSTVYCMYFDGNLMWLGTNSGIVKIPVTNKLATLTKGK
jgi:ligand-binding sensor domain-containing protein